MARLWLRSGIDRSLKASLSVCMVKHDDAGNTRLVKKGQNNTSRDDVAAALSSRWRSLLSGQRGAAGQGTPIRNGMSRAHRRLNKRLWGKARWSALERDGWRCVNRFAVPFHPAASKTGLNEPRYLVELPLVHRNFLSSCSNTRI